MAETIADLRAIPKLRAYNELNDHIGVILDGIADPIAGMATIASLVHHSFGHLWTGFYRVIEPGALLRVGPYQGSLGCLDIAFGRGVCGVAAAEMRSVTVPDVSKFPGHITCDARARSEIVVPVVGSEGDLIAVFDVDSERIDAFSEDDRVGLELLVSWFAKTQ
jgi:L-methionine (R)-S-oxide reductase